MSLSSGGRKGQVELFAVVGLVVVIAVIAYFSYQSGIFENQSLASLSESQRLTRDSINEFIMSGASETLRSISEVGGEENSANSVTFLNKKVAYWSKNGVESIPDMTTLFNQMLTKYIKDNKEEFSQSFGKDVSLGEPVVNAVIFDNKIDITVNMPTTVNGKSLPRIYKTSMRTNFGSAYKFAKGFVKSQNTNRFIEMFTISSIIISPLDSEGIHSVPISISLYDCGGFVYRGWNDIKPNMEYIIKSTLANIYLFGRSPKNDIEKTSAAQYEIPPFDINDYSGINVSFHLEDNFELDMTNFQMSPNPIIVVPEPIPMLGTCTSKPNIINYYLKYPVIVRVKDTITGNILQFAIDVFVKNNKPGSFASLDGYDSEFAASCEQPLCSANIQVVDTSGNPIEGATASFFNCGIGKSDENGYIESAIPCGYGNLVISKSGYGLLSSTYDDTDMSGLVVELRKMPRMPVYIHRVNIQKGQSVYLIDAYSISDMDETSEAAQLHFISTEGRRCDNNICTRIFRKSSKVLDNIPEGNYTITAGIGTTDFMTTYGMVLYNYTVKKRYGSDAVHIYVPYMLNFVKNDDDNEAVIIRMDEMRRVLEKCGIIPVSDVPLEEFGGCSVPYDEVQ